MNVPHPRRQSGIAAVETVLVLPFILFFVLAAVAATQFMLIRQHNAVSTRTTAWQHSLLEQACSRSASSLYGGQLGSVRCNDSSNNADRFYRVPGSGSRAQPFIGVLRRAPAPQATQATGSASFDGWRESVSITDRHSIDATPVWEMRDLPLGYDQYLRGRLSRKVFPNYFPRAR